MSAAVLPFRRRRIFETAQKSMVGRVPVISLFGVLGAILFAPNNELVKKAVRKYPKRLRGYVWPDPHASGALQLVRRALGEWGFRGIKLHPLINAFLPTDEVVLPIMDEARKRRVPVAIHSGHPPFSLPWSIGELAELYPDVRIVMLHMGHGNGVYIQAAINTAKRYDNIILETSGMPMHTKVKEAVKEVGDERVVFGSDYPFHHHSVELQRIQMAGLTRKGDGASALRQRRFSTRLSYQRFSPRAA